MKNIRIAVAALLSLSLSSCLFKEPVFKEGFTKPDATLTGVWMVESENHDPRERSYAVVAQVGDALMIHYPVNEKGGTYMEARSLKVRERDLLQIRAVASFEDGLPAVGNAVYTVAWVEKTNAETLSIRVLSQEGDQTAGPAQAKKVLEDKGSDWNKLFGEAQVFTRLKDK